MMKLTNDDGTLTARGESVVRRFAALVLEAHGDRPVRRRDLAPATQAVLDASGDASEVFTDILIDPALRRDMASE